MGQRLQRCSIHRTDFVNPIDPSPHSLRPKAVTLSDSRFCRHLGPDQHAFLDRTAQVRRYHAGEIVFVEGQTCDGLYVINEGVIHISAASAPNRTHVLSRMEAGEYFGEMAVFDGLQRSATATALEESVLSFVPINAVLELLATAPILAASIVRNSSLRMREFNRRFLDESLKAERLQLVERLARTIVHDFRNPLNVIGIAADLAAEEGATVQARRSARDRIRKQIEVINRMMHELLEFTRVMPVRAALPTVAYDEFLKDMLLELHAEAALRGVAVKVDGPIPEVRLRIDPPRLSRVFTNLYQNAFDSVSGREGACLSIRFSVDDEWVTTEISDNGGGIPAAHLHHVFEPFFTHGKDHGTGLGLAICDRIVREHGGRIEAESESGNGATFRVRLPRTLSVPPATV